MSISYQNTKKNEGVMIFKYFYLTDLLNIINSFLRSIKSTCNWLAVIHDWLS